MGKVPDEICLLTKFQPSSCFPSECYTPEKIGEKCKNLVKFSKFFKNNEKSKNATYMDYTPLERSVSAEIFRYAHHRNRLRHCSEISTLKVPNLVHIIDLHSFDGARRVGYAPVGLIPFKSTYMTPLAFKWVIARANRTCRCWVMPFGGKIYGRTYVRTYVPDTPDFNSPRS